MTRRCYAVLAEVSLSYSPLKGRLVTCYSPVRHFTQGLLPFLVRLACVRHAASVDSEPGSNSRLKPDAGPLDGGRDRRGRVRALDPKKKQPRTPYLVRSIKPNSIASHDWHVQPFCQRSLRALRLSGAPLDRGPDANGRVSSNLMRFAGIFRPCSEHPAILREPFKTIEVPALGQVKSLLPNGLLPEASSGPDLQAQVAQRKISNTLRRAQRARATKARESIAPGSCNGLFSVGFPTGVQGLSPHLTQRTSSIT